MFAMYQIQGQSKAQSVAIKIATHWATVRTLGMTGVSLGPPGPYEFEEYSDPGRTNENCVGKGCRTHFLACV